MLLKEQETKHSNERKILQDQCQELEKNLESLRIEYHRLEDYWADKLDEERQLFRLMRNLISNSSTLIYKMNDDYKRVNDNKIMEKNKEINKPEDEIDKIKTVEMKNISIHVADVNSERNNKST